MTWACTTTTTYLSKGNCLFAFSDTVSSKSRHNVGQELKVSAHMIEGSDQGHRGRGVQVHRDVAADLI